MDAGAEMGRSKTVEDHPGATREVRSPEQSQQETGRQGQGSAVCD